MAEVESSILNVTGPVNITSRSAHVVEQIRERFLAEEWSKNKELYCESDIERLRESDWFVKRFLLASRRNPDEAFQMLKKTLAWRKTHDLPNVQPNAFPQEFYQIGGLFEYECDLQGNPVIYMRIRMHRKVKELHEPVQQFLFYIINKVDEESKSKGCVVVFDCTGAGYANVDLDLLRSLIDVAFNYFPFCVRYVIVYELSWVLNAFRKIALSFIPSPFDKLIKFANKNDITNYIAIENLPDFMNGTCTRDYRAVPQGCSTVTQLAEERGFSRSDVERIMTQFEPFLVEARQAIEERKRKHPELIKEEREEKKVAQVIGSMEEVNQTESSVEAIGLEEIGREASIALVHVVSRSFEEYASVFPQNTLQFRHITHGYAMMQKMQLGENKEQNLLVATILIRNNHHSKPLAFKIQSNKAEHYSVTPRNGVLVSGAYVCVQIISRNPTMINKTGKDKFLVLMTPEIKPEVHMKSSNAFNQLFVQQVDRVFCHKLMVIFEESAKRLVATSNHHRIGAEITQVQQLSQEVKHLRRKCHTLETRLVWFNFIPVIVVLLLLMGISFGQIWNYPDSDTTLAEHWSNLFKYFIGSTPSMTRVHKDL